MEQVIGFMLADCRDPDDPQGRSYRQVNAAKTHTIPVGTLVELESGVRLFVAYHSRDCDQTPLYWLTCDTDYIAEECRTQGKWDGGYLEDSLTVVEKEDA